MKRIMKALSYAISYYSNNINHHHMVGKLLLVPWLQITGMDTPSSQLLPPNSPLDSIIFPHIDVWGFCF